MSKRECPFCGKVVPAHAVLCPHCRETLPEMPRLGLRRSAEAGHQIRRGLLYMLVAATLEYFATGYSALKLPVPTSPLMTDYLLPLLFLSGLGLTLYGIYRRLTS